MPVQAGRSRLVIMDAMDADVLLVTGDGVEITATADLADWYPPGAPRPADSPEQWSAMVSSGHRLETVLAVGDVVDLHLDAGGHGRGTVERVYPYGAQLAGRGAITP